MVNVPNISKYQIVGYIIWLVVLTILKHMKVRLEGSHPIYEMEKKKCLKPPASHVLILLLHPHIRILSLPDFDTFLK